MIELLREKAKSVKPCDNAEECGNFTLTFSCGAAMFPNDADDLKGPESCADDALYIVKKNGRNGFDRYRKQEVSSAR